MYFILSFLLILWLQENKLFSIVEISENQYFNSIPERQFSLDKENPLEKEDSVIRVPLLNGGFRDFKDYYRSIEWKGIHEYVGEIKQIDVTVLSVSHYENWSYLLISV